MLQPKRTKFRKMQKGRVKGMATRGHSIAFGSFGLKALGRRMDHSTSVGSSSYRGDPCDET